MQNFTTDETVKLVGPFVDNQAFIKKITTRDLVFLPFALIPHVSSLNLIQKGIVCILVPVMVTLGLKFPQLIAACTKTIDNNPHVTVQDKSAASTRGTRVVFVHNKSKHLIDADPRNRSTTFGERYPHFLDRVFKLCDVEREEDLPVIWH